MSRRYPTPVFTIGDKVAYSVQFLRSIGMCHGEIAHARGIITKLITPCSAWTLAEIKWNCDMPEKVNTANLAKVGPNPRFANVD